MSAVDEMEMNVLRAISGVEIPGLVWGAAMSVAVSALQGRGLIKHVWLGRTGGYHYVLTDKGRELLKAQGFASDLDLPGRATEHD